MNTVYNEIILEVAKKFKITESEAERIIDSQFKYVTNIVNEKADKTIQLIYLGKFTPNKYKNHVKYREEHKVIKTDNPS
jgi:nucleoid DNA-binding protein